MDNSQNAAPMETAEELAAEKDYQTVPTEEAIRDLVVKEYGLDPENEDHKTFLEAAVRRELGHRTTLSKTIGQKIKYREGNKPPPSTTTQPTPPAAQGTFTQEDIARSVSEALEQRDLDALEYPDDIKAAIKRVAKTDGVSIKKAISDPFIASKIETWQKDQEARGAAIMRTNKSGGTTMADDPSVPPNVDMNTAEGRKAYDDWKAQQIAAGY